MDCCRFLALVGLILTASTAVEGLPQRIETYLKTFYVAVTEVEFTSTPYVCISLINATKPCLGKSGRRVEDLSGPLSIIPTAVQSLKPTSTEDDELIDSSLLLDGRAAQQPGFFSGFTARFSNALGLTRTLLSSITLTRTVTTTYVETVGQSYFEIQDCIPPVLHYPLCTKSVPFA